MALWVNNLNVKLSKLIHHNCNFYDNIVPTNSNYITFYFRDIISKIVI